MLPERALNLLSGKPRADRQAQVSRQESQPRPKAMVVAGSSQVGSCLLESFRECASDSYLRCPSERDAAYRRRRALLGTRWSMLHHPHGVKLWRASTGEQVGLSRSGPGL